MNFLTELFNRLQLEGTKFHNKLVKFGKSLITLAISLSALPALYEATFPKIGIDFALLLNISGYIGLAGFIISIVAGTVVKDPDLIDKKRNNV